MDFPLQRKLGTKRFLETAFNHPFLRFAAKVSPSHTNHRIVMIKKAVIVVVLIVRFGTCTHFAFQTRSGTHQSREDAGIGGLPENATDINY